MKAEMVEAPQPVAEGEVTVVLNRIVDFKTKSLALVRPERKLRGPLRTKILLNLLRNCVPISSRLLALCGSRVAKSCNKLCRSSTQIASQISQNGCENQQSLLAMTVVIMNAQMNLGP